MKAEYVSFKQGKMEIEVGEIDERGEKIRSETFTAEDLKDELL